MKLSELIDQELIFFNLPSLEKVDFLKKLISLIVEKKSHLNESIVSELIIKREEFVFLLGSRTLLGRNQGRSGDLVPVVRSCNIFFEFGNRPIFL